jgi:L-amino acid N-acyltransferase YncA
MRDTPDAGCAGLPTLQYARAYLLGTTLRDEVQALLQQHWDEVAHDKTSRQLAPDWAQFDAMERAGMLFVMTVRAAGLLVGYACAIMRPHLHSAGTLTAYVDAMYLAPRARHGRAGARFLRYIDAALAANGAQYIYWHIKPERDFAPILQRSLGYHFVEEIWGRTVMKGPQ